LVFFSFPEVKGSAKLFEIVNSGFFLNTLRFLFENKGVKKRNKGALFTIQPLYLKSHVIAHGSTGRAPQRLKLKKCTSFLKS
jgi:hypothetical protein